MTFCSTNRRTLSLCSFAFLLLALFVFTWGLEYKVSRYDPPQSTSRHMAKAKLLSTDQDEQTSVAAGLLLGNTKGSTQAKYTCTSDAFILCLLILSPLDLPSDPDESRDSERPWRIRAGASLSAFFFRPPPIFS